MLRISILTLLNLVAPSPDDPGPAAATPAAVNDSTELGAPPPVVIVGPVEDSYVTVDNFLAAEQTRLDSAPTMREDAAPPPLVEPGRALNAVTSQRRRAPTAAVPPSNDRPRSRVIVDRGGALAAARATVMLAATTQDPIGTLSPRRDEQGAITAWRIRAPVVAAKFGVCSDDAQDAGLLQPAVGFCSGFVVAPELVLTAGHCIDAVRNIDALRVVVDYTGESRRGEGLPGDRVLSVTLEQRGHGPNGDWALLRLVDRTLAGRGARTCRLTDVCDASAGVFAVTHRLGMSRSFLGGAKVLSRSRARISTDLDGYAGASGSPVFDTAQGRVLGMIVSGPPDFRRSRSGCLRVMTRAGAGSPAGTTVLPIDALPAELRLRMRSG